MALEPFTIKQGDTLAKLRMQCLDSNGPVDIYGLDSELRISSVDDPDHAIVLGSVVADDPTLTGPNVGLGWWEYDWQLADVSTPGTYGIEVSFTYITGAIRTWPTVGLYPVVITKRSS